MGVLPAPGIPSLVDALLPRSLMFSKAQLLNMVLFLIAVVKRVALAPPPPLVLSGHAASLTPY